MDIVETLVLEAQRRHGRIDGLHNIARNPSAQRDDLDLLSSGEAAWLSQFRSHFIAYSYAAKIAIPIMRRHGGGAIINTSSGQGPVGGDGAAWLSGGERHCGNTHPAHRPRLWQAGNTLQGDAPWIHSDAKRQEG